MSRQLAEALQRDYHFFSEFEEWLLERPDQSLEQVWENAPNPVWLMFLAELVDAGELLTLLAANYCAGFADGKSLITGENLEWASRALKEADLAKGEFGWSDRNSRHTLHSIHYAAKVIGDKQTCDLVRNKIPFVIVEEKLNEYVS